MQLTELEHKLKFGFENDPKREATDTCTLL